MRKSWIKATHSESDDPCAPLFNQVVIGIGNSIRSRATCRPWQAVHQGGPALPDGVRQDAWSGPGRNANGVLTSRGLLKK